MSTLDLDTKRTDSVVVLYPKGLINAHTVKRFEEELLSLIKGKSYSIVINCKSLTYIASAGLGVLMGVIDEIRTNRGDIRFAEMNPNVHNIFEILGFTHLYKVFKDEEKAIKSFDTNPA
ncbi:STAS domain-containing protein [Acidobacteriota bacterium]